MCLLGCFLRIQNTIKQKPNPLDCEASLRDASQRTLKLSEWLFLLTVLFSLTSFLIIAKSTSFRSALAVANQKEALVSVEIRGAVYKPGVFEIEQGASLGEVLKKARPKPLADCAALDMGQTINQPLVVEVCEAKEVTVEIKGWVKEGLTLTIPAGTRVCDLKNFLELLDDTDRTFFKSRKLLRNGDVISIPKRKAA